VGHSSIGVDLPGFADPSAIVFQGSNALSIIAKPISSSAFGHSHPLQRSPRFAVSSTFSTSPLLTLGLTVGNSKAQGVSGDSEAPAKLESSASLRTLFQESSHSHEFVASVSDCKGIRSGTAQTLVWLVLGSSVLSEGENRNEGFGMTAKLLIGAFSAGACFALLTALLLILLKRRRTKNGSADSASFEMEASGFDVDQSDEMIEPESAFDTGTMIAPDSMDGEDSFNFSAPELI
jgi:hypothetical protein